VYELLLERTEEFQRNLNPEICGSNSASSSSCVDGDDMYFHFSGAAFCDMLHQRYQHIKSCQNTQRDIISQEIIILQAVNAKDKTKVPQYLRYQGLCIFVIFLLYLESGQGCEGSCEYRHFVRR